MNKEKQVHWTKKNINLIKCHLGGLITPTREVFQCLLWIPQQTYCGDTPGNDDIKRKSRHWKKHTSNIKGDVSYNLLCFLRQCITLNDVLPVDFQVTVPVRSALLVPETNSVADLMGHHVFVFTAVSDRQPRLPSSHLAHFTPTTEK